MFVDFDERKVKIMYVGPGRCQCGLELKPDQLCGHPSTVNEKVKEYRMLKCHKTGTSEFYENYKKRK